MAPNWLQKGFPVSRERAVDLQASGLGEQHFKELTWASQAAILTGPAYWGLHSDWLLCAKGRRQSPVNIDTRRLVYDAHLEPLRVDNNLVSLALVRERERE